MRAREDLIVGFLFLILLLQGYIIFIKSPGTLVKDWQKEDTILLQGKDPSEPSPLPGQQPQIIKSGPVPVVSFGEGQPTPTTGLSGNLNNATGGSVQSYGSGVNPAMASTYIQGGQLAVNPGVTQSGGTVAQHQNIVQEAPPDDPYRKFLLSLALLEKSKEKPKNLTKEQAKIFLDFIRKGEGQKEAVPSAQKSVKEALTQSQLAFIEGKREEMKKKGAASPDKLDEYAQKVLKILKEK